MYQYFNHYCKMQLAVTRNLEVLHNTSHFMMDLFINKMIFSLRNKRKLSLVLYIDDFEVCNPLGTSQKKHKITAVYWALGDIQAQSRSTLASIYLATLCKAENTKHFGFQADLEPLLTDLQSLESLVLQVYGKPSEGLW